MARTGRPRGFDKNRAMQQAMLLFWAHGYEGTSLALLKAAMGGISAASFYAAFGSKERLFRATVDRYLATHGQVTMPLRDATLASRAAIERALRQSVAMQTDPALPLGCLVVLSTCTCSPETGDVQVFLLEERERNRAGLRACVERAIAGGELPRSIEPGAFAALFDTFLVGISMQARDGVSFAALDAAVSQLMQVWDTLAASVAPGGVAGRA